MLFDLPLLTRCRLVDPPLEPARLQSTNNAADLLDLLEQRFRLSLELGRECLDIVRPAEGIDDIGDAGLVGKDLLRAERHLHGFFCRQRQSLVHRISVQ